VERDTERSCEVVDDDVPVANCWPDEVTVGVRVCSEPMGGFVEVAEQKHGAIIERVGEWNRRVDPAKPVPIQGKLTEEGRAPAEWVDCTADVVNESGERELGRPAAAANRSLALDDLHRSTSSSQRYRRGQSVGTASYYDCVERRWSSHGRTVAPAPTVMPAAGVLLARSSQPGSRLLGLADGRVYGSVLVLLRAVRTRWSADLARGRIRSRERFGTGENWARRSECDKGARGDNDREQEWSPFHPP